MRHCGLAKEEWRIHVHRSHAPVLLLGHVGEVIATGDSGHIDEYVEATEHFNGFGDGGETLSTLGDVSDSRYGCSAGGGDHRNSFCERLGIHVMEENLCAFGRESHRGGSANARTCSGEKGDLAVESARNHIWHGNLPRW